METLTSLELLTGKQTVTDYPYGRLKCTITFQVEFKPNKGYRGVTQTINPKTGRLNAPKAGTYNTFEYIVKDDNGHVKFRGLNLNGYEDIQKFIELLNEYDFIFSAEESDYLYTQILANIYGNVRCTTLKEGVTKDDLWNATKFHEFKKLFATGANINEIKNVDYDIQAIKNLKVY